VSARGFGGLLEPISRNFTGILSMKTTKISTNGQIVPPKKKRTSRNSGPPAKITVEETDEAVLPHPTSRFPNSEIDEVAGCLKSEHKPATRSQMRGAVDREVIQRRERGRY
jgi:bifunctional DNA-binding transcriptional regulator/antitoxin component of YhaV-PrlF toxin-antitoxin module